MRATIIAINVNVMLEKEGNKKLHFATSIALQYLISQKEKKIEEKSPIISFRVKVNVEIQKHSSFY